MRNLKIAARIFHTHRTRTLLSVLGVVIGITAVIAIINAGEALRAFMIHEMEVFGTDYVEVEIKVPSTKQTSSENAQGLAQGVSITTLKYDDALAIKEHPNISNVYAGMLGQEIVSYEGNNRVGMLWGVSAEFFAIDKNEIAVGRAFTEEEDKSLAPVVVLGYKIKQDLFGDSEALGQKIKIGQGKYRVIGVREELGGGGFVDLDDMILIPLHTLQKKIAGVDHISFILGSIIDMDQAEQTAAEITDIMRREHDITDPDKDDFAVVTSAEAMEMIGTVLNAITLLLVAIAAISLIVGGVGIMNIMYVSVLERTYEIGLRKAVGAHSTDILRQFLWEAILITALGGAVGVVFGIGLTYIASTVATNQGFDFAFIVSLPGIITAVSFMVAIGIIFGYYPARRAAKLDPVEALRYE